ncbi:hypothetical protein U9R62_06515 [Cylindrospermopsis raciborskii DSH]
MTYIKKPVISLAILGDEKADWKPEIYNYSLEGVRFEISHSETTQL